MLNINGNPNWPVQNMEVIPEFAECKCYKSGYMH